MAATFMGIRPPLTAREARRIAETSPDSSLEGPFLSEMLDDVFALVESEARARKQAVTWTPRALIQATVAREVLSRLVGALGARLRDLGYSVRSAPGSVVLRVSWSA